ncbi:MAG: hypothetical protein AAF431_04385 [Pseudomonadota bacterium]
MKKMLQVSLFRVSVLLMGLLLAPMASATGVGFQFLESTPIGSWQVREDTDISHKKKTTVSVIRSSLLGSEMRNGEKHYWIEMVMNNYKVSKKGKRKKDGDQAIIKTLVSESALKSDPANVLNNLRGFGAEIIMQSGDQDPMRITGAGGFMGGMMQAMDLEVNYNFTELGNESVTVPAGDFDARKVQGSGTTEAKVIFKKIKVDSDSTAWLSKKVPFGIVKSEGTTTTNKKTSTQSSELLEYGMSGATSLITKEPKDMPTMGNMFNQ